MAGNTDPRGEVLDLPPIDFITRHVSPIAGWLNPPAAMVTIGLLDAQEAGASAGGLLEIGVFKGKYFAVLLRSALRRGDKIVGLDTFEFVDQPTVKDALSFLAEPQSYELIEGKSTNTTAAALRGKLGGPARFISIDGSHGVADVLWDLELASDLLAPGGIVALDDFLNPVALGVNEGAHRFFQKPRPIAPFGFAANKLFLCAPQNAQAYKTVFLEEARAAAKIADAMRKIVSDRDPFLTQPLWGHEIVVMDLSRSF